MSEQEVREIAMQIVKGQLLANWLMYALMITLSAVTGFLGALGGAYAKKRGETQAIERDIKTIISQQQRTAEAVEQVRTQVAHSDWAAREWKTIQRLKLEELLVEVTKLEAWQDRVQENQFQEISLKEFLEQTSLVSRFSVLYVPELKDQIHNFTSATTILLSKQCEVSNEIARLKKLAEVKSETEELSEDEANRSAMEEKLIQLGRLFAIRSVARTALESAAGALMRRLFETQTADPEISD